MHNIDFGDLITQWTTLSGPWLLMAFLLMLGYAIKVCDFIDNRYIPRVLMIAGPCLSPFIVGLGAVGDMDPRIPFPVLAIWLQAVMRGFILASVVWMSHVALIKRLEDFLAQRVGGAPAPGTMSDEDKKQIAAETAP